MKDTLKIDSPAGKIELETLSGMKVGDQRKTLLMPAIPSELEWTCVDVGKDSWTFEATFCGCLLLRAKVVKAEDLTFNVEGVTS